MEDLVSARTIDYVSELRLLLLASIDEDDGPARILDLVQQHATDFVSALTPPDKNERHRREVESGKLELNGVQCSLNKDFIDSALRMSDFLELDEKLVSAYLDIASHSTTKYDRDVFNTALYIYFTVREIILDTLRHLLLYLVESASGQALRGEVASNLCEQRGGKTTDLGGNCLHHLKWLETKASSLEHNDKRDRLLGPTLMLDDRVFINRSLARQHELTCYVHSVSVKIWPDTASSLQQALVELGQVPICNNFASHRTISAVLAIQALSIDMNVEGPGVTTHNQTQLLREIFQTLRRADAWKCKPLLSALQLVFAAELSGLCRELSEIADRFDYDQEVLLLARSAIQSRVFQHWITFSLFCKKDVTTGHLFSMFFTADALMHYEANSYDAGETFTASLVSTALRRLAIATIINLPDLLKEIHIQTEDQMFSNEINDTNQVEEMDHTEDLFYGMIFTAYAGEPDSGKEFWEDRRSNLYGFMVWASNAEAPSTVYAYFRMMSALSSGKECAQAAFAFFDPTEDILKEELRMLPAETSSWTFIFDSFRYYIGHLDKRTGDGFSDAAELDPHNALILDSYVELLRSVLADITDFAVLHDVNTKFEALSICFQLLSQHLPTELYLSLFGLISIFAKYLELQKTLWLMLEAWLGAMNLDIQTAMLTSSNRQRQVEHRPLNSLTTFSLLHPAASVGLIDCLTALSRQSRKRPCTLSFPATLGDNSRYPGITDYVDFVWKNFQSADTATADTPIVDRIRHTTACVTFFETCLTTFDLAMLSLSPASKSLQTDVASRQPNSKDFFAKHPASRVLYQLGFASNRQALLGILKNHDTADSTIRELIIPAVTSALRVCRLATDKLDEFEELCVTQSTYANPKRGNISDDISQDPTIIVHIALLCCSSNFECSLAAIQLLTSCEKQGILDHRQFVNLCSTDHSKTILLGLINLLDNYDEDVLSVKSSLLNFILSDLRHYVGGPSSFSVAHFMLGFVPGPTENELSQGIEAGHIASGHSMLHSLVSQLNTNYPGTFTSGPILSLHESAMAIVLHLVENTKTASSALQIIREQDFIVSQLSLQQSIQPLLPSDVLVGEDITQISSNHSLNSLRRRTAFMRCCARELLTCEEGGLREYLHEYTQALFPMSGGEHNYGMILVDWLDVLDIELLPVIPRRSWQYFDPELYLVLLERNKEFDLQQLQAAIQLRYVTLLDSPEQAANSTQITSENEYLLQIVSTQIYNNAMQAAIQDHMIEWSILAAIVFGTLLKPGQAERRFSSELVQALLVKLPRLQESDSALADTICESISTLLQSTDFCELNAFYQFFRTILICLQSPASTQVQREHLYLSGIYCLQSIQTRQPGQKYDQRLVASCKSGAGRLLTIVCQDAGMQEDLIRITACAFLDLLLKMCEDPTTLLLSERIVQLNLLTRFAYQFEVSLKGEIHPEALSRQFDLVLRLAMTRVGAQDIIRNYSLLSALAEKFFRLEDGTEDVSNAIRLLSVHVACVIALGLQMSVSQSLLQNFASTWREKLESHARRMQKAKNPRYEEYTSLLQLMASLQAPKSLPN